MRVLVVDGAALDLDAPAPAPAPVAVEVTAAAEDPALAFADFYRSERDRLVRAMALTLGDADLGAEAVDEAFVRAFQRWRRVGAFDDPAGWVYRVALNWATSVLRRRRRAPLPPVERDTTDVAAPGEPTVTAALAQLPVDQRAVIVCRYYLHLSERETAAALGVRPGTVKSRSHRALQTLEARLSHLSPKETA